MYAIALLQGMVFYGPVATLYRQARGISIFQITVIESISLALCLLLEFPWGILADKIGYKKTILICNFLCFFSKIVFWKADSQRCYRRPLRRGYSASLPFLRPGAGEAI